MADNMNGNGRTKADVIVEKISRFDVRISGIEGKISNLSDALDESKSLTQSVAKTNLNEHEQLKTEIKYVSAQLESVCVMLNMSLNKIAEELAELKKRQQPDLDELASRVAAKIIIPEPQVEKAAQELDYDALGYAVAKSIYVPRAVAEEIDYDDLASKIAEKLPAPEYTAPAAQAEVDYDLIAAKVSEAVNSEPVSCDYIAARVAEQIVLPASEVVEAAPEIDLDELSSKIAEKITVPVAEAAPAAVEENSSYQVVEVDGEQVAEEVVARLSSTIAETLDTDEIADRIAKRVGSVSPEEFEITVDDDGCDSLAKAIEDKLDYDSLAAKVAERIAPAYAVDADGSIDSEELATAISDKLTVNAAVNEDALAEKAAAILSNYMPEVDNTDIADKVIAGIIPAIPSSAVINHDFIAETVAAKVSEDLDYEQIAEGVASRVTVAVDGDAIADNVSARILENQTDSDYDIVIDDEGVAVITDHINEGVRDEITRLGEERYEKVEGEIAAVKEEYSARFDKIDGEIEKLKELLLAGAVVLAAANNDETAAASAVAEETEEEEPEEQLVTVSDVVGEEIEENGEAEEQADDDVIEEIVSDIDEAPSDGEIMPDGMEEESEGGVDFANMMKYNRSFIARIIQSTDEQKNYYGRVKTALLSYKKVNSNIAWGAERFNKGRETIARFKIRGKTLCLYLALDPKEFEYSVYHQVDVSDNKSMHGTPMMVKIKSPRGVKKAIRLIDAMLAKRDGVKRTVAERDYAAMYPYETIDELIEDGLVKDVSKK